VAASDSVVEANAAYGFSELSIREEADRWKPCSVEVFLEWCNLRLDAGLDTISTGRPRRVHRGHLLFYRDAAMQPRFPTARILIPYRRLMRLVFPRCGE